MTRIFGVAYLITERVDNEIQRHKIKQEQNVTAKNAAEAIRKVEKIATKPEKWYDNEDKKYRQTTWTGFDPIEVTLEAEA